MSDKFTLEDIQKIDKGIERAREEDKPFPVYSGDEISVIGDANKTELEKVDFEITFRYGKDEFYALYDVLPSNGKETPNFVILKHVFKDVYVNPRNDTLLAEAIIKIVPFFQEFERLQAESDERIEKIEREFNAKFVGLKSNSVKTTLKDEKKNAEMMSRYEKEMNKLTSQLIHFYNYSSDDIRDGVYEFVGSLLQLDKDALDHVIGSSALNALLVAMRKFPELWNESELVF